MAKKAPEQFISPANLWGKPLPGYSGKKEPVVAQEETPAVTDALPDDDEPEEDEAIDDEDDEDFDDEEGDEEDETEEEEEDVVAPEETIVAQTSAAAETVEMPTNEKEREHMAEKKSGADHIRDMIAQRTASGESLRGVDIVAALAKKKIVVSPAQVSQLLKKAGMGGKPRGMAMTISSEDRSRIANQFKLKDKPGRTRVPNNAVLASAKPRVATAPTAVAAQPVMDMAEDPLMTTEMLIAAAQFVKTCEGNFDAALCTLATYRRMTMTMDTIKNATL